MSFRRHLEEAIRQLESHRAALGDDVVDAALAPLLARRNTEGAPEEQRRIVTVLFADVSGFSRMSEHLDPEDVASMMNFLWERVDHEIASRGGRVDKHIGDAVMALFGLPVAHPDDAIRAVQTGLAIQHTVRSGLVQLPTAAASVSLRVRVGIHTGAVHAGLVPTTGEYTVMGDTVNLASRLEDAAPAGGVLVSRETFRHLRERFHARRWEPLRVKGKQAPVEVHEIVAERGGTDQRFVWEVAGLPSPFVGRAAEVGRLCEAFEEVARSRRARRVLLVGGPGMGKSRLLAEFGASIAGDARAPRVLRARARSAGLGPYGLLRDLLASALGVDLSDLPASGRTHVQATMERVVPGRGRRIVEDLLAVLRPRDADGPPAPRGTDEASDRRRRGFSAITDLLAGLTRNRPAVILLDDLHAADPVSLELMDHILDADVDLAVLIAAAARPEDTAERGDEAPGERRDIVPVSALPAATMHALATVLLEPVSGCPAELKDRLVEIADGSPHHLEELVRHLADRGVIRTDTDRIFDPSRLGEMEIPTTLATAMQARVDALESTTRHVLQVAATVGQTVWEAAVAATADLEEAAVTAAIDDLVRAEVLVVRPQSDFSGTREMAFRQTALRSVVYDGVLQRQRRVWHGRIAAWMDAAAGGRLGVWSARIAEHWEAAGDVDRAVNRHLQTGHHDRALYALTEAAHHFDRVVALLDDREAPSSQRAAAFEALARIRFLQARTDEARRLATAACDEARRLGDDAALARGLSEQAMLHVMAGDPGAGLAAADEAVRAARRCGQPALLARAANDRAYALFKQGRLDEADPAFLDALETAEGCGDVTERFRALRGLTGILGKSGRFDEARRRAEQLLALAHAEGVDRWVGMVHNSLGEIHRTLGDYGNAESHYRSALAVYEKLDIKDSGLLARSNLGGALVGKGEAAEARRVLEAVVGEAPPRWFALPETLHFLASALLDLGEVEAAHARAVASVELARGAKSPEDLGPALRALGSVVARRAEAGGPGSVGEARKCFVESADVLSAASLEPQRARTLRTWADHEARWGDEARAVSLWEEAQATFERLGFTMEAGRTEASRATRNRSVAAKA